MMKRIMLFLLLLGVASAAPTFAASAAIGMVAGSMNASVSGQALLPNTSLFSGDQLQVNNGAAVIALANGSRMTLGSNTQAQFFKETDGVSVTLAKGSVSMFHPANGSNVAVNAQSWSITPGKGYKSIGQVAMLAGAVVVTAKEGSLHVVGNGRAIDVAQGKTITLVPKNAATPQAGTSQKLVGGSTALEGATLGVAGGSLIAAIIAAKKASDANTAATAANSQATAATSAALAANSAAVAATSAAALANSSANAAGCALNTMSGEQSLSNPSPYTPPTGFTCP